MKILFLYFCILILLSIVKLNAQGAFIPDYIDYEKDHPRLLFKKSQLKDLQDKWQNADALHEELGEIKDQIIHYSTAFTFLKDWSGYDVYKKSCSNAVYATSAAFRYAMNPDDLHPSTGENFAEFACRILTATGDSAFVLQHPGLTEEHPGVGEEETPYDYRDQKQLDGGFGLMHYCYIYDILKGVGYFDDKPELETKIRNLIITFATDYYIHISKYGTFVGWWDKSNHRIIAVCALGIAAMTVNDHESESIPEQPMQWISYAMHHYYDNLMDLTTPGGGYAESVYYITYVFHGVIPFAWSHLSFTKGYPIQADAVDDLPYKYHPACVYQTPFLQKHRDGDSSIPLLKQMGKFVVNLRLPDGSKPNFDDGDYSAFWSPILAAAYKDDPEAVVFHWDWLNISAACKTNSFWGNYEMLFVAFDSDLDAQAPGTEDWPETNVIVPKEGKAVLRSGWKADDTYLAVNAAYDKMNSTNHQQADNGTFILARGEDVLVIDSGHYRWPYKFNFNKASNHNRILPVEMDIPYLHCKDVNDLVEDPPAYITNFQSDGCIDYLKVYSPVRYEHPKNYYPMDFDFQRTFIFDREAVEPYYILIDQVHNHWDRQNFIWRLHGHCDADSVAGNSEPNAETFTCTWHNIGNIDKKERSQLETFIGATAPLARFKTVSDKYMHSYDAFHAFYYHDCLEIEMNINKDELDKIYAVLQPGPEGADLLDIQQLAVLPGLSKTQAIKYTNKDTSGQKYLNVFFVNKPDETPVYIWDPADNEIDIAISGAILFAKLDQNTHQVQSIVAEDLKELILNGQQYYHSETRSRTQLLKYDKNMLNGKITSGSRISSLNLAVWLPGKANNEDGLFHFTLAMSWSEKWQKSVGEFQLEYTPTKVEEQKQFDHEFLLSKGYPNPFNSSIRLDYTVPQKAHIAIAVYNIAGQHVKTLVNSTVEAGEQQIIWDGTDLSGRQVPTGVYFCRMTEGELKEIRVVKVFRVN